jgi:hypothetical protein
MIFMNGSSPSGFKNSTYSGMYDLCLNPTPRFTYSSFNVVNGYIQYPTVNSLFDVIMNSSNIWEFIVLFMHNPWTIFVPYKLF